MTQVLYHGTSSLYIPYLLQDGLSGRYPAELYIPLLRLWKLLLKWDKEWEGIRIEQQAKSYINKFFVRQQNKGKIQISLTTRLDTAMEYIQSSSYNRRIGGEGISFLLDVLKQNWKEIKTHDLDEVTIEDLKFITQFFSQEQKGVILSFWKHELMLLLPDECENNCLTKVLFLGQCAKKQDEIFFDHAIRPDLIYILPKPFADLVKLEEYESVLSSYTKPFVDTELFSILQDVKKIDQTYSNRIERNNVFEFSDRFLNNIPNNPSGGKTRKNKKLFKSRRSRRKANTRRGRV